MELETAQFGKIQVEEDKIITMRTDIIGFAAKKHFVIFEKESTRPFYWFQCIDDPNIALTIINPYLFKPDYSVDVEYALKEMSWDNDGKENIKIYVVVNATNKKPDKITANLIGPLLINTLKYEAVQLVLYNSTYSHKCPVFSSTGSVS